MAADENRERRTSLLLGAKVCTHARTHQVANARRHRSESCQSCGNWTNSETLSSRQLATYWTHETLIAAARLSERSVWRWENVLFDQNLNTKISSSPHRLRPTRQRFHPSFPQHRSIMHTERSPLWRRLSCRSVEAEVPLRGRPSDSWRSFKSFPGEKLPSFEKVRDCLMKIFYLFFACFASVDQCRRCCMEYKLALGHRKYLLPSCWWVLNHSICLYVYFKYISHDLSTSVLYSI